jgi:hypothetical protein
LTPVLERCSFTQTMVHFSGMNNVDIVDQARS